MPPFEFSKKRTNFPLVPVEMKIYPAVKPRPAVGLPEQ